MQTQPKLSSFDIKWIAELGLMELRWPKARTEDRSVRPVSAGENIEQPRPRRSAHQREQPSR